MKSQQLKALVITNFIKNVTKRAAKNCMRCFATAESFLKDYSGHVTVNPSSLKAKILEFNYTHKPSIVYHSMNEAMGALENAIELYAMETKKSVLMH